MKRSCCSTATGSLLMHVQELETIARHGLNILIVVLKSDGAYGSEIHKLRRRGPFR